MKIKAEHEDTIFPIREFVVRLGIIQDEQFEKLYAELLADDFPADPVTRDLLFDYLYNTDLKEDRTFEEFIPLKYRE